MPPVGETMTVGKGDVGSLSVGADGQLTTQSNEFERAVAYLPEPDLCVPVVDPLFDMPNAKRFRIKKPEVKTPETDPTSKEVSVRMIYEAMEELVSTDGTRLAPGYLFRPRPFQLCDANGKVEQKNTFAQKDLNRQLIAGGLVAKGVTLPGRLIVPEMPKLEGKEVFIKLTTSTSSKRDKEGNFFINQNMAFAAVGEQGNGTAEVTGSPTVPNY